MKKSFEMPWYFMKILEIICKRFLNVRKKKKNAGKLLGTLWANPPTNVLGQAVRRVKPTAPFLFPYPRLPKSSSLCSPAAPSPFFLELRNTILIQSPSATAWELIFVSNIIKHHEKSIKTRSLYSKSFLFDS